MRRRCGYAVAVGLLAAIRNWGAVGAAGPQGMATSAPAVAPHLETINTYCVGCHDNRIKTGGLSLAGPGLADIAANPELWEKVLRKVRGGKMPPPGVPAFGPATRSALIEILETTLDRAAKASPNPGRPLAHRLNRAEYANAIRDLLALTVDVTAPAAR